jgi:hypothetical protein
MGAQELWKLANNFDDLGVVTSKPRIGSIGSRCEHHYVTHIRDSGDAAAYADMTFLTAMDIFQRIQRFEVRDERNRLALELLKASSKCECNVLRLWTPRGNPNDSKGTYVFPKTEHDAAVFAIFFNETDPAIWRHERIGEPRMFFFNQ